MAGTGGIADRRARADQAHRRADDGEPLVRPHARLPQPARGPRTRSTGSEATSPTSTPARRTRSTTSTAPQFTREPLDPCHGAACVAQQISGGMGGFVANFVETNRPDPEHAGLVMGYYDAEDLPVYAHLARRVRRLRPLVQLDPRLDLAQPALRAHRPLRRQRRQPSGPPIYDLPSFVRHLDDAHVSWRWYSHDPATLRAADGTYRARATSTASPTSTAARAVTDPPGGGGLPEKGALPRRRGRGQAARGVVDRPELRRPAASSSPELQRRPPAVGRARRPGAGADRLPRAAQRARRGTARCWSSPTTSTAASTTTSRHPRPPDDDPRFRRYGVRVPALVVSPLVPGRVAGLGTSCSTTRRSSRRSSRASAPARRRDPGMGGSRGGGQPPRRAAHAQRAAQRPGAVARPAGARRALPRAPLRGAHAAPAAPDRGGRAAAAARRVTSRDRRRSARAAPARTAGRAHPLTAASAGASTRGRSVSAACSRKASTSRAARASDQPRWRTAISAAASMARSPACAP